MGHGPARGQRQRVNRQVWLLGLHRDEYTILIRTRSYWKALSRKVIYLIEDGNIWWFNMDYRLEKQRNSEMIFHRKMGCGVQHEGNCWQRLETNNGAESTM